MTGYRIPPILGIPGPRQKAAQHAWLTTRGWSRYARGLYLDLRDPKDGEWSTGAAVAIEAVRLTQSLLEPLGWKLSGGGCREDGSWKWLSELCDPHPPKGKSRFCSWGVALAREAARGGLQITPAISAAGDRP